MTTDQKPEAQAAAWKCDQCGNTSDVEGVTVGDNWCCSCGAYHTMETLYTRATLDAAIAEAVAKERALSKRLLESLQALVAYDSYKSEYDGRMLTVCPSCGEQDGEHTAKCDFTEARAAIRAQERT